MLKEIRFILQCFRLQFIRKRTFIMFLLIFILMEMYMFPVIQYSVEMDHPVTVWLFPFIISDIFFLFLFMCCILYFNMDIPFFQEIQSYRMLRIGRKKWITGQMIALLLRCFFIMVITVGLSVLMLMPWAEWKTDWGKLVYTIAFLEGELPYDIMYIRYEALQKFTPLVLTGWSILVGTLVLMLLSMISMFFSLIINKIVGTAAAGVMVAFVFVYQNQMFFMDGILRYFSPVTWMRVMWLSSKKYGSDVLPPLSFIFTVGGILILVMGFFCMWRIKKVEINWEKEDC